MEFVKFLRRSNLKNIYELLLLPMLQTKKLTKSCGTVVKSPSYELGAINLYLKGAVISVNIF